MELYELAVFVLSLGRTFVIPSVLMLVSYMLHALVVCLPCVPLCLFLKGIFKPVRKIRISIASIVFREACVLKLSTQVRIPGRWAPAAEFIRGEK